MKIKLTNKTDQKQLLNTLKESHSVLSSESIEIEDTDIYPHELKRAELFFKIERETPVKEAKKPTANVDKTPNTKNEV